MRAVVKQRPETYRAWQRGLELVQKESPVVRKSTDVRLEVVAAGICGTDVGIYQSKDSIKQNMSRVSAPNVTIGHEFCGKIVDAGPQARIQLAELLLRKPDRSPALRKFIKGRTASRVARDSGFLSFLHDHCIATAEMHVTCGKCAQCKLGEYHV